MGNDFVNILPLLIVAGTGILTLFIDLLDSKTSGKGYAGYITAAGLFVSAFSVPFLWGTDTAVLTAPYLKTMLSLNPYGFFFTELILISGILVALISINYMPDHESDRVEFYSLLSFSVLGMIVMVTSTNLISLFIGLEIMSLSIYIMVGFKKNSPFCMEASLKYFILGAFASAFYLFGVGFLYGSTGSINIEDISQYFLANDPLKIYILPAISITMLVVAFGFKIAAVPFHMWTPDAYEGAPTPVTAFMAAGVKVAAFGAMGRVFIVIFQNDAFMSIPLPWETIVLWLSVITMTIGNLIALPQENVKRMLGYSSIAHAGYILLGLYASKYFHLQSGSSAHTLNSGVPLYLWVYLLGTFGTFGVLVLLGSRGEEDMTLSRCAGLSRKHPLLAMVFSIGLLSLAGIPPTAGFFGKFYLFKEVLLVDVDKNLPFVIVAVLNSVIAVYYYLKVIIVMYMHDPEQDFMTIKSPATYVTLLIVSLLIIQGGIYPSMYVNLATKASSFLVK